MNLDAILKFSHRILSTENTDYVRVTYDSIDWNGRLIMLQGFRGVGKTTLLLQYALQHCDINTTAFLTLDHLHFTSHTLLDTVDALYEKGYTTFILDEVHRYPNWSIELKNLYDGFKKVKFLCTASSALEIQKGQSDLSRRADIYVMEGMNFTEYMQLMHKVSIPNYTFSNMLNHTSNIADAVYDKYNIKKYFTEYIKYGCYPIIKEGKHKYYEKVIAALHQTIDIDLPAVYNVNYDTTRQVKRFLALISKLTPYQPNISTLARDLNLNRISLLTYLDYLESASVFNLLKSGKKSGSVLTKPDKVFLANTNLLYALTDEENKGTLRETFVHSALKQYHSLSTPVKGDLLVDNRYSIEIGGASKNFHQLDGMANPVLIKDDIITGGNGILPMWMLALLKK